MIHNHTAQVKRLTAEITPFTSAEDVWFWFIQAHTARQDGAKIIKGFGHIERPCEPVDILTILNRLYRSRRLLIEHIKILHHYGVRMMSPDPHRTREVRAHYIWQEALARLETVFLQKGIMVKLSAAECHHG